MNLRVHVCMHICVCERLYVCMHVCVCLRLLGNENLCKYVSICVRTSVVAGLLEQVPAAMAETPREHHQGSDTSGWWDPRSVWNDYWKKRRDEWEAGGRQGNHFMFDLGTSPLACN